MRSTENLEELLSHIDAEVDCLVELESCLLSEQVALRRLDAEGLLAAATRKAQIVDRQFGLSTRRAELLDALLGPDEPRCLSAMLHRAASADHAGLVARRTRLEALVRRVQRLQAMNQAYAETGRQTVSGALARLLRRRAGPEAVYGADGRVHAPDGRRVVREQG
ncbi:flagellar protein FlgN [Myxococcota bacterium]|nr:flagellar protein FlgN [Myxococcota bacterium]